MLVKLLKSFRIMLSPVVVIYGFIIKVRNYFFDKGIFHEKKVNAKIIAVGNITVGGSGKTPAVMYITNLLKNAGYKVGILSRGYRRKTKGYLLVSKGEEIDLKVEEYGDEIVMVTNECMVPTAVSERRVGGVNKFLKDVALDAVVLDDAYQHRWIHRDLNIMMIDQRFLTKKETLEQKLLPLGLMREPFSSTDRADIIIINKKFSEKIEIPERLKKFFPAEKTFYGFYEAKGIFDLKTHHFYKIEEFTGQKSLVVCGIARPYSFLNVLEKNKINITNKLLFDDHQEYTVKEVQQIRKKFYDTNSFSVLTTQKDAVKLAAFSRELDDIDIYYLKIDLMVENNEEFNKRIIKIF
ncbi:MAG: tetraacyldisaccharide 4'-kinase [bacterium]